MLEHPWFAKKVDVGPLLFLRDGGKGPEDQSRGAAKDEDTPEGRHRWSIRKGPRLETGARAIGSFGC